MAPIAFVIALVNATSVLMERRRDGEALAAWKPFLWEYSSALMLLALAPLIGLAVERWPFRRTVLPVSLAIHAGLTLPFSLLHVLAMVAIRKAGYALIGGAYDFTHGQPLLTFLYEGRKDVVSYALFALVFWLLRWRADAAAERAPASAQRIEVRDGATALYLDPADILRVEAAGNYVEFHTSTRTHLVRGTLAVWEAKLAALGFVRAHRSRVVNRARIRAIRPTPSGDLVLTMDDGSDLTASRRYRDGLTETRSL